MFLNRNIIFSFSVINVNSVILQTVILEILRFIAIKYITIKAKTALMKKLKLLLVTLISCILSCCRVYANETHTFQAQLNLIGQHHTSNETWLRGELGRYDLSSNQILGELQFSYQYAFSQSLEFSSHLQVMEASESNSANNLGLVEFKLHYHKDVDWHQQFSLTAGQFFLPISMENSQAFWESPYSIHFSSLNSWIGEEFRPIGIDTQYQYIFDDNERLSFAATLFAGNDSMGALLAYRGWSIGRHRSALGDILSIPELDSLNSSGAFAEQRDDGTRPFGKELDNRPGYALRSQFFSEDLIVSLAWIDNRGDRKLHRGEYAWDTKFVVAGAAWLIDEHWELLTEATQGRSTMGAGPGVDMEFYSAYVMTSYLLDDRRISLRLEQFGANDKDSVDNDNNDLGRAITLAGFWQPENTAYRLGAEIMYLNSKRTKQTLKGLFQESDSISFSFMANYDF